MKEAAFVKQNADKWKRYEAIIKSRRPGHADELANDYISVTDDLAYASTFYPDSNTTRYLNQLSRSFHSGIYRNKKESASRIIGFFTTEIPRAVFESHRQLLYSFLFFLIAVVIGLVSSAYDHNFPRIIMGDGYVNMSLKNIRHGDPMGVYKSMEPGGMFLGIAINNIFVSLKGFVLGIFLSIGSVYFIIENGVMVGAFVSMFAQKGLTQVALLSIFLHGALELSAIVIAGGAGITVGNSILFPGTYTRTESLAKAAKRGLKIMVGLIPVFIIAAIFESFVTRHYQDMPVALSLTVIILSFTFITWYYIILPLQLKAKSGWKK
jgi:uncharacterized membrane protein SpoIIM required for sporulation